MQSSASTPSLGETSSTRDGVQSPTATPIGGRSVASPAMIRILLTPAHSMVSPDEFEWMAGVIRRLESVRLIDLTKSEARGESIPVNSALGKLGEVHVSFITSYDPSHSFLSPFSLHKQVLGVLGLTTVQSAAGMRELEYSPGALRQLHPSAVIHRVFAFDTGAARDQTVDLSSMKASLGEVEGVDQSSPSTGTGFAGRATSGLVVFPAVRKDLKDVRFYLKTLMPEFISSLLDGLDTTVKGLQGKPLETPRETLDGTIPSQVPLSPTASKTIGAAGAAVGSAASRASSLFSSFSEEKKGNRSGKATQSVSASGPLGAGRFAKIKADYYLLAGDLWNALHTYDSCMSLLGKEKAMAGGQDAVWYASALEGWAVARFLVARMGGGVEEKATCLTLPLGATKEKEKDKEKLEFQFNSKPWSDIAEAYSLALGMYTKCLAPASYLLESGKSITPDTPRDYTHPLIHTSACLAYARFLLAIWASGGWNGETFDQLLYGGVPPALAETTRPTTAVYTQHCTASGIQRSDIASPASLALTNSSTNGLKLLDQLHLYSSLAAIFGSIGFARKEAYTLRRLQVLVVSLIASGTLLRKKETNTVGQLIRIHTAEQQTFGTMATTMASVGSGENADSVLVLALQICQTYGVEIEKLPIVDMDEQHILSRAAMNVKDGARLSSPMLNRGRASWAQSMSSIDSSDLQKYTSEGAVAIDYDGFEAEPQFGWKQQQVLLLKDTLSVCEMLEDEVSMLFFGTILLRDFWASLSTEDQVKVKAGMESVQAELRTKGQEAQLEYWGPPNLLDDMELVRHVEDVQQMETKETAVAGTIDVALGNKSRQLRRPPQNMLIDEEVAVFIVTLYNPLSITLDLETIRLDITRASSVGSHFEPVEATSISVPPRSVQSIRLTGTPHGEGRLLLRGIVAKCRYCVEKRFAYERTDGDNVKHLAKVQSDCDDRWTRTKQIGLEARRAGTTANANAVAEIRTSMKPKSRPEERFMTLNVMPKVPRLLVRSTASVRNGSMVMLGGEEQTIELTLHNRSPLDADYVHFDFEDDLQSEFLTLLAEGHLSPAHVYELEHDLLHRPFLWRSPVSEEQENDAIPAGQSRQFVFRAKGKLDVRRACIKIRYGNARVAKEMGRERFWTRQAAFRFQVRVLPVIALDGLQARALSRAEGGDDKVMLGMRVHNLQSSTVTFTWQLSGPNTVLQRVLHPNSTSHIYLPFDRLNLSEDELSQAIPKLMERQFIVSKVKLTAEEDRMTKIRFWLRKAFLEKIQVHRWEETKTGRTGEVDRSTLFIDDPSLASLLRQDQMSVSLRVEKEHLTKYEFVSFIATISNSSPQPYSGHYRLGSNVQERLANYIQCVDGHLHGSISSAAPISAGETREVQLGLCFLASGHFAFTFYLEKEGERIAESSIDVLVL